MTILQPPARARQHGWPFILPILLPTAVVVDTEKPWGCQHLHAVTSRHCPPQPPVLLQWWHIEALWFANISNAILWFTYVKGCFRVLSGMFGSKITFKTTLKGAGKLLNSAIGDLWMPFVCLVLLVVSFGKGLAELVRLHTDLIECCSVASGSSSVLARFCW